MAKDIGAIALPAYIFDSNVAETIRFDKFKSALNKKEENWVVDISASGANYFFKRKSIKAKLDLYVVPDMESTTIMEGSIKKVLGLFGNKVRFDKHIVAENQKNDLKAELGITSYPALLINNQFKVSGVQSPEMIKDKFCEFNSLAECSTGLPKDIISLQE